MAKVKFTSKFYYHWQYADLENYKIQSFNAKNGKMKLVYDEARAGEAFDSNVSPRKIKIIYKDLDLYVPEHGEYAGQTTILSGRIQKIQWQNSSNKLMVEMTDIDLDAGLFHYYLLRRPSDAYESLLSGKSEFTGAPGKTGAMDVLTGPHNDVVTAGPGGAYIKDLGGADRYIGTEDAFDAVTYRNWTWRKPGEDSGVDVNLSKNQAIGPDGLKDKLFYIDEVRGTIRDDNFIGDNNSNLFVGDRGNDTMDGRGGFDRARYDRDDFRAGDGIRADLKKGIVKDGHGTVDKIKNIEGIIGGEAADVFLGDNGNNWFRGNEGADEFRFRGKNFGDDFIDDFNRAEGDKIVIPAADKLSDLSITYQDGGTLVELNGNSSVWLEDWTKNLNASDFIF